MKCVQWYHSIVLICEQLHQRYIRNWLTAQKTNEESHGLAAPTHKRDNFLSELEGHATAGAWDEDEKWRKYWFFCHAQRHFVSRREKKERERENKTTLDGASKYEWDYIKVIRLWDNRAHVCALCIFCPYSLSIAMWYMYNQTRWKSMYSLALSFDCCCFFLPDNQQLNNSIKIMFSSTISKWNSIQFIQFWSLDSFGIL